MSNNRGSNFDPTLDVSNFFSSVPVGERDFIFVASSTADGEDPVTGKISALGMCGFRGDMESFGRFCESAAREIPTDIESLSSRGVHEVAAEIKFFAAVMIATKIFEHYHPKFAAHLGAQIKVID